MKRILLGFAIVICACQFYGPAEHYIVHAQINNPQSGNVLLSGATGSIGGSLLAVGASATGTATISGAQIGMPCEAAPSDGTNMPALGAFVGCTVTSANTATVNVVAVITLTPALKTYNVRVMP